jgi:hypothetical protein
MSSNLDVETISISSIDIYYKPKKYHSFERAKVLNGRIAPLYVLKPGHAGVCQFRVHEQHGHILL